MENTGKDEIRTIDATSEKKNPARAGLFDAAVQDLALDLLLRLLGSVVRDRNITAHCSAINHGPDWATNFRAVRIEKREGKRRVGNAFRGTRISILARI